MQAERVLQDITNFIFLEEEPQPADIIFIPGGSYPQIAERAAALWKQGFAPYILPSGQYSVKVGHFPGCALPDTPYHGSYETEWDFLRAVLEYNGVAPGAILREDQATFTMMNAVLSKELTDSMGLAVKTAILCCKAYHARRSYQYYQSAYPATHIIVCPAETKGIGRNSWHQTELGIHTVCGELARCGNQFSEIYAQLAQGRT